MNLELQNICVSFSQKVVLEDVNILFQEGMIHGLLGDNGAGKSTTANIISGELQPSSGQILINGNPVQLHNSKSAIKNRICYVHQRPMLSDSISIKENLLLGLKEKDKNLFQKLTEIWLKDISVNTIVKNTGSDTRFFIALASALLKKPEFLILDEPGALLDENQRNFLYKQLQQMAKEGMNILVITHSMEEAEKYCDTIVRLENGIIKDSLNKAELKISPTTKKAKGHIQIHFNHLTARPANLPAIFDVDFYVSQGEVVLIQGLPEDGLVTLENVITGFNLKNTHGSVEITDQNQILYNCNIKSEKYSIKKLRQGLKLKNGKKITCGIIPTDKKFRGSNPLITIKQMLTAEIPENSPEKLIEEAGIDIKPEEKCASLSGGMLQRLLLARELSKNPEILFLCQPLQGLDVTACQHICKKITETAETGAMVIILASDNLTADLCTRTYKLKSGKLEESA